MILIRKCNELMKTMRLYKTFHSNFSTLSIQNDSYLFCGSVAKSNSNKFGIQNTTNFNDNINNNDSNSFQYNIMRLHQDVKQQYVKLKDMKEIIEDIENNNRDLSSSESIMLLKCCGNLMYDTSLKWRQTLTNCVWNHINKKNHELTIEHYHALLNTYIDNSSAINSDEFLKNMIVKPQYDTYCLLFNLTSKLGDIASTEALISNIHNENFPLSEDAYNALIYVYAINGEVLKAKHVINTMMAENIIPSAKSYEQLMYAFAKTDDIESLTETLKTTTMSMSYLMELVKFLSLSGKGMHIPKILKYMHPLRKSEKDVLAVIVQLVNAGHFSDAYRIITEIPIQDTFENTRKTFAFCFVKEMIESNGDQQALLKFINDFEIKYHILEIWEKAAQFALNANNKTLTLTIFTEMKKRGMVIQCQYYWPLLSKICRDKDYDDIYLIIRHMSSLDVKIDSETFISFVFPYINTSDPVRTVQKIYEHGVPLIRTIAPFMKFLFSVNRVKESLHVCRIYNKKVDCQDMLDSLILHYNLTKDIHSAIYLLFDLSSNGHGFTGKFLRKLVNQCEFQSSDVNNILKFLSSMKLHGAVLAADERDYIEQTIFRLNLSKSLEYQISSLFNDITTNKNSSIRPPYMNEDQLKSRYYSLKNTGKYDIHIIRKLFQVSCYANNVVLVNELLKDIKLHNITFSPGMEVVLFNFYTKNEMIDKASFKLHTIQSLFPDFKIDNFKILQYVQLLIKQNRIKEAFSVIEHTNVNQKSNVIRFCCQLINLLAENNESYVQKMLDLLVQKGYCEYNSTILSCLVRIPCKKGDIKSAVDVFKECAVKYKITPAKHLILSTLIKEAPPLSPKNTLLLDEVYDFMVKVNGEKRTAAILTIVLIQNNKIEELKIFLKKQNICNTLLVTYLKYLSDDDILAISWKMLEIYKEILKIDLNPICNLILAIYRHRGKLKDAEELREKMYKKGVIPSKIFENTFNALLKSHKLTVTNS
ncbi:leucine-rich PPR motif-containing protein, mitochondrial-like [Colletes latitarsis]|uniref:leucine-rich PPR motif-containing protein, mitochondrial-like n=1 Tax=Colletes latitarsis TaxID=2605962 RepID=UPI004035891B